MNTKTAKLTRKNSNLKGTSPGQNQAKQISFRNTEDCKEVKFAPKALKLLALTSCPRATEVTLLAAGTLWTIWPKCNMLNLKGTGQTLSQKTQWGTQDRRFKPSFRTLVQSVCQNSDVFV